MTLKTGARLVSLLKDEDGTVRFCLELEENIRFTPGQYARVTIAEPKYQDERGNSRTFTLLAYGETERTFWFATRSGPSAFKKSLLECSNGARLEFIGPFGRFIDPEDHRPTVFFAGGIGITPVLAMLYQKAAEKRETDLYLFHVGKSGSGFPLSELAKCAVTDLNTAVYVQVGSQAGSARGVETGKLDLGKIRKYVPEDVIRDAIFYISGPNRLVKDIGPLLLDEGIPEESIRIEIFPGY